MNVRVQKLKEEIDNWFYYNRPELQPTEEFLNNIVNELKDELINLETGEKHIILSEYLRLNYGNIAYEIVQEILLEEEFEPYRDILYAWDTPPFMRQGDFETIAKKISENRITEKYGSTYEELLDNTPFYEELRVVIREVSERWKNS